jgi:hypothetical protein
MDYSKFCTTDDVNFDTLTTEIYLDPSLQTLYQILKKILDFEAERRELINYDDVPQIIELFKKIPNYVYRNPVYFTLGYLATRYSWSTVWKVQELLSTWLGVSLVKFHTIRYYRYLIQPKNAVNL